jgi:hypothetical protein
MIPRSAFYIERTGLPSGAVRIERINIGDFIVLVAGKLAPCAHAYDTPARFDAFAARRAISVERARHSLNR